MRIPKSLISFFLLLALFTGSLFSTGCPKSSNPAEAKSSIEKAARASFELASLSREAVRSVRRAYEEKLITLEQKDRIAEKLSVLIKGGKAFNALVKKANETYQASGDLPPDEWKLLEAAFSREVLNPFSEFVAMIGAVKAERINVAVESLRAAVQIIAAVFGKSVANLNPTARSHVTNVFAGFASFNFSNKGDAQIYG